jgi:hypothetical protein
MNDWLWTLIWISSWTMAYFTKVNQNFTITDKNINWLYQNDDEVILFSRQAADDGGMYSNIFSVTFAGQTSVKSRVIVSHLGDDGGTGTWTCAKDRGIHRGHITSAQNELQRLIQVDPTATDGALHEEVTEYVVPGVLYLLL